MRNIAWLLFAAAVIASALSWGDMAGVQRADRIAFLLCFAALLTAVLDFKRNREPSEKE